MENTTTQTTTLTTEGNTAPVTNTALAQEEIEEDAVDAGEGEADTGAVVEVETTPAAEEDEVEASTLLLGGVGIFVGLILLLVVARKFVD
jgi:hypothetical protein